MSLPSLTVFIESDGTIEAIDKPESKCLTDETTTTKRISHVEPVNRFYRVLFHLLRKASRDESLAADWTRRWKVTWQVKMFGTGDILGPFEDRKRAIEAEVKYYEGVSDGS